MSVRNGPSAHAPSRRSANTHVLVVGAGVAGLSAALHAAEAGAFVTLVCEGLELERGGNTQLAQGGIAAAIGPLDTPEQHADDTIAAGAGLVDARAAQLLAADGAAAVRGLITAGFAVDRTPDGSPVLGMEGAHGIARIVHAGEDRSGAALHAFLRGQVLELVEGGRIALLTSQTVVGLAVDHGAVTGVDLRCAAASSAAAGVAGLAGVTDDSTRTTRHTADAVILATGGYAGLFSRSTNAAGSRGDGLLFAARAGALLADLEFVQFHPTVLHGTGALISEAVRGAGAVLRDASGRRFMEGVHPLAELAPRDVVAREIHRVMRAQGAASQDSPALDSAAVWIDATSIERTGQAGTLARRFPAITAAVQAQGFDWAREPVPVSPAAHYSMGGVVTDLDGRTTVPGLFAAGEVASTGVHGANRLASNSLLEGLVFGRRAGIAAARAGLSGRLDACFDAGLDHFGAAVIHTADRLKTRLEVPLTAQLGTQLDDVSASPASGDVVRNAIDRGLGIVRSASDLRDAALVFASAPHDPSAQLASLIAAAASSRTESRGAHQRSDFPETDPAQATRQFVQCVGAHTPRDSAHTPRDSAHAPRDGAHTSRTHAPVPTLT